MVSSSELKKFPQIQSEIVRIKDKFLKAGLKKKKNIFQKRFARIWGFIQLVK